MVESKNKEHGATSGRLLNFRPTLNEEATMADSLKRSSGKTLALAQEELDLLEVLSVWEGQKAAFIARCLYYKGIQAFLKDHDLCGDRQDQHDLEMKVHRQLETWMRSNRDLEPTLRLIRNRADKDDKEQDKRRRA